MYANLSLMRMMQVVSPLPLFCPRLGSPFASEKALDYQIGVRGNGIQVSAFGPPWLPGLGPQPNTLLRPRILKLFKILGLVTDIFDNSIEPPRMTEKLALGGNLTFSPLSGRNSSTLHKMLTRTTNLLKHGKRGSSENEALEVDWVIGADGARGTTPKRLGINFWGETVEKQGFPVAEVDMEGPNREYWAAYESAATRLVLALPMPVGPAPHFAVVGNETPKEIQKAVDIICGSVWCGIFPCHEKSVYSLLLSTYETDRMPPIKEMLELTTNLHTQSMSDGGMASKDTSQSVNPRFARDHIFKQLGVNYQ
ncbi:hypothetical protein BS47DRAFT_1366646 [Hydnum rufescens UP504]|uniref:FAD-binding domain-containing protein n=1 Tax=Hydnum rufescens UP504 TaxID=1448309 RepID=A0A9P6AMB4_9AGAM|nr:hypothetical protein BS47DRAFT_1366646 [Hydnum rufescens UP504]